MVQQAVVREHTLKGKGDPHGRAGRCSPLLQLPLLEGVMGLSTALKWSGVVGVIYMVLLSRVHLIRLVCVLICGGPCTHNSTFKKGWLHLHIFMIIAPTNCFIPGRYTCRSAERFSYKLHSRCSSSCTAGYYCIMKAKSCRWGSTQGTLVLAVLMTYSS